MKRERTAEYKLLTRLFFRLLPYQVLLIVINAVNGIVDSLYASNAIGQSAMSAIGLFGPFNHFLYAVSMVFVSGSQILYGKYLANERQKINGLFTTNLLISGGLSTAVALLLVLGAKTGVTRVFIDVEPDLQMFNSYILGQAAGIPALVLGQQLFAFLSLENRKRLTMAASIACFVLNAILDHVFIVMLDMGTFGLGLSTAVSMWAFLGIQAVYYLRGKSEWKFSLKECSLPESGRIFLRGYPGALSRFVEMFRCLIVNGLILQYEGNVGISSFAASNSLLAVIWAIPFGMVAVSRMLFSISIGEEDRKSLINVFRIVLTWGMMLMGVIIALLVLGAEPLTRLFYHDPSDPVYHMTVMGFRLLPLCMPLAVVSLHFACFAQSAEKKALAIVLPVCDGMVGVVLFSYLLIPSLKMNGLYLANILNGVLCFAVVFAAAWISRKKVPRTLEEIMDIPKRIGVEADARIDISVQRIEEVQNVSQQIIEFCHRRRIDEHRSYFAGLCMEEMAGNVVEHGFVKDKKEHSVDIRVIHKDDAIIMRIRDNCKAFDPYSRMASESGDPWRNIGIKMVYRIASEINYQNLLGMNVLTIRI